MEKPAKKYQVFISSTYEDLKEERFAVIQTLLKMDCIPAAMEHFPANDMSQLDYIENLLDNCDYYILILAGKYGSIDPRDGKSYTEKEYDYACAHSIPIMSFLFDDLSSLPSSKCEDSDDRKQKLNRFREKASSGRLIRKYSSIEELQKEVATSLYRCIMTFSRPGWIRDQEMKADSGFEEKATRYLKEELLLSDDIITAIKSGDVEIISAKEKRRYDLAAKGIIELDDDDKELIDAIKALGWENDVIV